MVVTGQGQPYRAGLAEWLQAIWYREQPPPRALRVLSRLFALLVELRRAAYARGLLRSSRVGRPVIVVGNLTVGGSGKTPLVIWLCEQLLSLGFSPGVILRGYGGVAARARRPQLVEPHSDVALVGDEALLLRERAGVPVVICPDRVRAARRLLAEGVDVIVADDGLQHLSLTRNFELAVIDAARGFGNGYLLPAGPLREPRARLASVDALVLKSDGAGGGEAIARLRLPAPFVMQLLGDRLWPLSAAGAPLALSSLAGRRVHALAGIADPQSFFAHLAAAGLEPIRHPFPDHHRYRAHELEFGDDLALLMTEKDAVKCRAFAAPNRWFLPVAAGFSDAQTAQLRARLRQCIAAAAQPL